MQELYCRERKRLVRARSETHQLLHHCESIQFKRFTTEDTDDCMDAGGRAMHGAIAENTEFYIELTPCPSCSLW
jgi:tRNA(Arg) A34 adenosine deaminase TadA